MSQAYAHSGSCVRAVSARAGRLDPDVRVVHAERLIDERLALLVRRADAVAVDARVEHRLGGGEAGERHLVSAAACGLAWPLRARLGTLQRVAESS